MFYLRSRRQPYFLLCCFYGCFGFGLLYLLLYTLLVTDAPPMFYVSDIGWISCFLFVATMVGTWHFKINPIRMICYSGFAGLILLY